MNLNSYQFYSESQALLLINKLPYFAGGDGGNYWIGATRAANGRDWIWYPSNDPLTFTNWEYGQPDSHTDADGTEDCVHLWNTQEYKWNDSKCHYYFFSVCEEYCLF